MKYSSMLVLGMCVVGLVSVAPVQDASAQGGWTTLFDGSNLDSFNPIGDANWEIADGIAIQPGLFTNEVANADDEIGVAVETFFKF